MREDSTVLTKPKPKLPRPNKPYSSLGRRWRYFYYRLIRLRDRPHRIARGLAVGVFAGCFPFFGLQTITGVLLATLLRGNRFVAVAGTWISNPLTYVPIFAFNFHVGQQLLRSHDLSIDDISDWESLDFAELGPQFVGTLLTGCAVVGFGLAIASYFSSLYLFKRLHKIRQNQRDRHFW
ncbi:MAG: DUF2062 domain-containing protein [Jaaginema sp. PMC 1079.18]|nr:DUF2062 domain-containing protein [Jaaginema sp. PMC 1080.18]MEC4852698.1 DUF2062 domain-containing protein [Jaaginema sp. PMC 1079.18]MEC4865972.1 DUF2062 domain-containing protein [Jaaginema sp. PMC 1078.18]